MSAMVTTEQCTECGADCAPDEMSLGCETDLYACIDCHTTDCGCEAGTAEGTE